MAGLDFKAVVKEQEDEAIIAYNTRMGLLLFFVYVALYGGFMVMSAFWPEVMSRPFVGGVNIAVISGFTLIVVALLLALVYMKVSRVAK